MTEATAADLAAQEAARDHGLRRGIGPVALAAAIVNITVGAGIFSLPGGMARAAGPYALLAYLICALAMGAVVLCCAEAGSRVPTSGGIYGYVEAAFGPLAGFVAGVLLWLGCVLACGGIAAALAGAVGKLWPVLAGPIPRAGVIVAVIGSLAVMNSTNVAAASRLISIGTAVKLLPLALFLGVGVFFVDPHRLFAVGAAPDASGVGRAILLSFFAFQGMETVLAASGEVKSPGRTLPIGLIGAMAFIAVLYVSIQLVAQGLLGAALAGSATPLADGLARVDPRLGAVVLAGAGLSMFVWIGSDLLGSPRVLMAFARDGFLPPVLGRVSAKGGVPVNAILAHAGVAALLAVTGTFEQLAVLSTLLSCLLYAGACAAAYVLSRRKVALIDAPLGLPAVPPLAAVGVLSMGAAIALAQPAEIAGLAAAVLGAGGLYALARLRRR